LSCPILFFPMSHVLILFSFRREPGALCRSATSVGFTSGLIPSHVRRVFYFSPTTKRSCVVPFPPRVVFAPGFFTALSFPPSHPKVPSFPLWLTFRSIFRFPFNLYCFLEVCDPCHLFFHGTRTFFIYVARLVSLLSVQPQMQHVSRAFSLNLTQQLRPFASFFHLLIRFPSCPLLFPPVFPLVYVLDWSVNLRPNRPDLVPGFEIVLNTFLKEWVGNPLPNLVYRFCLRVLVSRLRWPDYFISSCSGVLSPTYRVPRHPAFAPVPCYDSFPQDRFKVLVSPSWL